MLPGSNVQITLPYKSIRLIDFDPVKTNAPGLVPSIESDVKLEFLHLRAFSKRLDWPCEFISPTWLTGLRLFGLAPETANPKLPKPIKARGVIPTDNLKISFFTI
ncbi:Uncharacterised protein [Mycoplasmoides gallisepticum]|uniref:Uncharacterized protein n=1 Tax=Mycoplasmoides gallisepticum TaxID=2096 RepID=A0A3B0PAB6_MYCGL|nr:Uncharacterised protein [Mycoplasmoides gallisepticum]